MKIKKSLAALTATVSIMALATGCSSSGSSGVVDTQADKGLAVMGDTITYDPNYRPPLWKTEKEAKEQILWGLRQADLVKISDEEVQFLWGCSPEEGAERVLALGAKLVMVTLGPKGCFLKNAQAEYRCGCPQVRTVDTTGAGDIFGGSAVSRFLELGKTPEQLTQEDLAYMARYASAAASLSTEKSGAIPSIPTKEAVLQKMQEAY